LNRRVPECGHSCLFLGMSGKKLLTPKSAKDAAQLANKKEGSLVILRKPVAGLSDTALAKFVARASRASKLKGTVNILVTGSSELRSLNRRFRAKDQPTDVLSFPPGPCFVNGLAGDIAISADIAKQNARRLGHSAAQEIKILALHGVLHLVGYDHERDDGAMAGQEAKLRRSLGLPLGLIERNGSIGRGKRTMRARVAGGGARATHATRIR
jgi:probable rRNA maturation factor